MTSDRAETGRTIRAEVLGAEHVARSEAALTPERAAFHDLLTESAWGTVWASDAIPRRERSMLTVAILASLGNWEELALHLRACRNTGASRADIAEVFQHVAIYAGIPRANHAHSVAKAVWEEA